MPYWAQWVTLAAFAVLFFPGEWVYKSSPTVQRAAFVAVILSLAWIVTAFALYGPVPSWRE